MSIIQKILYATDLSETAREGMRWTKDLAAKYEAEVTIIHVIPDNVSKELASFGADRTAPSIDQERANLIDSKKEEILRICRERQKEQADCKIDLDHILVKTGQPVHEILTAVEGGNFDMVVMGTRGKGLLKKLLIGSLARQVVELCTVRLPTLDETFSHHSRSYAPAWERNPDAPASC